MSSDKGTSGNDEREGHSSASYDIPGPSSENMSTLRINPDIRADLATLSISTFNEDNTSFLPCVTPVDAQELCSDTCGHEQFANFPTSSSGLRGVGCGSASALTRAQELLDKASQVNVMTKSHCQHACQLCLDKRSQYYCESCRRVLCPNCRESHVKVSSCQIGDSEVLGRAAEKARSKLRIARLLLEQEAQRVQKLHDNHIEIYNRQRLEALAAIEKAKLETAEKFREYKRLELEKMNNAANSFAEGAKNDLDDYRRKVNVIGRRRLEMLNRGAAEDELKALDHELAVAQEEKERRRRERLQIVDAETKTAEQRKEEMKDFAPKIQVDFKLVEQPPPPVLPDPHPMRKKEVVVVATVPIDSGVIYEILSIDNAIWLLYADSIAILDDNGVLVRKISSYFQYATGMAIYSPEHILVATRDMGLLSFDKAGNLMSTVDDGDFLDVASNSQSGFALKVDADSHSLSIARYEMSSDCLSLFAEIDTKLPDTGSRWTMQAVRNDLYVCDQAAGKIMKFDAFCVLEKEFIAADYCHAVSESATLYLCYSELEYLLVCDATDNLILALDLKGDLWSVIRTDSQIEAPSATTITSNKELVVAGSKLSLLYIANAS